MNGPNFTKGPWHTHKRFMDKQKTWMRISIQSNEPPPHRLIAEMPDATYCNPKDCAESEVINANAALISAAPEMYRMLDEIRLEAYDAIDEYGCGVIVIPDEVFEKIAKVLATARGEAQE